MDSDTDSECELPPGWERSFLNGQTVYINHINNSRQIVNPLKTLRVNYGENVKKYVNKSCGFHRSKTKETNFIQKFDSFSTAEQVIINADLSLKRAIVIGGCSGVGLEIVHQLVMKNCSIFIGCPNVINCKFDIILKIGEESFANFVTIFFLELSSLCSTRLFCNLVLDMVVGVDIIIFCAGVMSPPYRITSDGYELTFQVNVLSQFLIQETLLKRFVHSERECRVVWVCCESHRVITNFSTMQLNPPHVDYNGLQAYALSNLCKILLVKQSELLWTQVQCSNRPLFFACHPGNMIHGTGITRYHPILKFMFWCLSPFTKSLSQAAATPLLCCTSPQLKKFSGSYFNNGCICNPSQLGRDETNSKLLWTYLNDIIMEVN